jgi:TPR repeat protein
MKFIFSLFLLSVVLFATTTEALNAYKNHNYTEAFKLYKEAALQGDIEAENALSYLYFKGVGVKQDPKKGLYWLQKAVNSGDSRASFDLAMFYLKGEHLKKDMKQAAHYMQIASKKGNVDATYNLALMYYRGEGVKQDIKKAAALLEIAAKKGHRGAKANVGRVYMQLLNFKKAKYWLGENLKDGDVEAAKLLQEIKATHKE